MKNYLAALTATAVIAVAPFALAASSTELTVTGSITPSACEPSFPGGSDVHYGQIQVKDLFTDRVTPMTVQRKTINVACDAPTKLAMHVIDNRPNTSSSNSFFGMGLTPSDEKIGHFVPWIFNVLADGAAARSILSNNQGNTWLPAAYIAPNQYLSVSTVADTTTPIDVENLSMELEVRGWIARADSLTLTEDVAIDGSVTFEMKYL